MVNVGQAQPIFDHGELEGYCWTAGILFVQNYPNKLSWEFSQAMTIKSGCKISRQPLDNNRSHW